MVPYDNAVQFQVQSGSPTCVELGFPLRGTINRLTMNQVDGTAEGYSFDIYDREDACQIAIGSSSSLSAQVQPTQHKVMPSQTVAPGSRLLELFEKVWSYQNRDGNSSAGRRTRLYLRITALGTGTKSFEVTYSVMQPVL